MAGVKHVTEKQRATHARSHASQSTRPPALPRSFSHSPILISPPYYETNPFSQGRNRLQNGSGPHQELT